MLETSAELFSKLRDFLQRKPYRLVIYSSNSENLCIIAIRQDISNVVTLLRTGDLLKIKKCEILFLELFFTSIFLFSFRDLFLHELLLQFVFFFGIEPCLRLLSKWFNLCGAISNIEI